MSRTLRTLVFLTLSLTLASPTLADDPSFGGFAMDASRSTYPSTEFTDIAPLVPMIAVADYNIVLEATPMQKIIDSFGGDIHYQGEAGGAVVWICYGSGDKTLWFYSDGEMGDDNVTMVTLDAVPPNPLWGCTEAPYVVDNINFGVPGLGETVDAVAERFEALPDDAATRFAYASRTPLAIRPGFEIYQELVYKREGDVISGISALQISGD